VIAGFCLFGALDHQRRVLHQSSLPYLSEDRDSTFYQVVSVIVVEPPELFRLKCANDRIQPTLTPRTSNGTILWSVGSPPDTTTVQQDRSRFTSHEGEFTITVQLINF
jgi:hypothetical protein